MSGSCPLHVAWFRRLNESCLCVRRRNVGPHVVTAAAESQPCRDRKCQSSGHTGLPVVRHDASTARKACAVMVNFGLNLHGRGMVRRNHSCQVFRGRTQAVPEEDHLGAVLVGWGQSKSRGVGCGDRPLRTIREVSRRSEDAWRRGPHRQGLGQMNFGPDGATPVK